MGATFEVGDVVVCIDAADIPSPPWKPLECGKQYVVRAVDAIPAVDGNYDKSVHKRARYQVRVWGILNPMHPVFHSEMGYAESRFERIEDTAIDETVDAVIEEAA